MSRSATFEHLVLLLEGMHDPRAILDEIFSMANSELCDKFKHYGNSYTDVAELDLKFWKVRLSNEVVEYKKCQTPAQRKRKLANLFNLVWMAYAYEMQLEGQCIDIQE